MGISLAVWMDFLALSRTPPIFIYIWSSRWSPNVKCPGTGIHFYMRPYVLLLGSKLPCTCVTGNLFSSGWIRWPSHWRTISTLVSSLVFQSVFISCLIYMFCTHWETSILFFQDEVSIWTLSLCFLWSQIQICVSPIPELETFAETGENAMVFSQMSSAYLLSVEGF